MRWIAASMIAVAAYNAAIGWLVLDARQAILAEALREAETTATSLTYAIEGTFDTIDRTLSGLAEVLRAAPELGELSNLDMHRLLVRRHAITPQLKALLIVGTEGRMRNVSSTPDAPQADLSDRDYFQAHSNGLRTEMFVGAPVQSRFNMGWIIPFSRAVEDRFGSLQAIMLGAFDPDAFQDLIAEHDLLPGVRVMVVLPNGRVAACVGVAPCRLGDPAAASVPADAQGSGPREQYLPGGAGPAAFGRGAQYGVLTVVAADQDAVLQQWWRLMPVLIGLSVLGSVAIAAGLVVLRRQIRARMAAMTALEQANADLERRVLERTQALTESEDRLRSFIRATLDAVVIVDGDGIIAEFNPAATRLFGYAAEEVVGRSAAVLLPDCAAMLPKADTELCALGWEQQTVGRRRDGSTFPAELTVGTRSTDGKVVHVGVLRDITERRAQEETLRRLANTDGLTGVFNRRTFMEEGDRLFGIALRHDRPLTVLMVDADHFKSVNDTHGHDIGDQVLRVLAQVVASRLRATDIFGRLGGEEFAAVLPETDQAGAERIAWAVIEAVRATEVPLPGGGVLRFTVSVGVGVRLAASGELADLLKQADLALYRAKKEGRDRVVLPD